MKLVIGGAYQGKQSYASKTYNLTDPDWKDGQTCTIEDLKTAKAVHHFHSFIRRELDEGRPVRDLAETIWKENPDLIIVTDEVGIRNRSRWTRKTGNGEKHAVGYVQNLQHMQLR